MPNEWHYSKEENENEEEVEEKLAYYYRARWWNVNEEYVRMRYLDETLTLYLNVTSYYVYSTLICFCW